MQGPKEHILTSTHKLPAFKNKIQVWKKHLSIGNIEMFPLLLQIQGQSGYKEGIPLLISHLESPTALTNTFLLCHQKCMNGLGTLFLGSHKIY
jgi:hypothetical protein